MLGFLYNLDGFQVDLAICIYIFTPAQFKGRMYRSIPIKELPIYLSLPCPLGRYTLGLHLIGGKGLEKIDKVYAVFQTGFSQELGLSKVFLALSTCEVIKTILFQKKMPIFEL